MLVSNIENATHTLSHIHYYRLEAYWLPYETSRTPHQFRAGTTFEQVVNSYHFDRKLRLHLFEAIEEIESSFRSNWAHQMALLHGPHSHLNSEIIKVRKEWMQNIQSLISETERSKEDFILHFKENYTELLPPVWAVCEIMSLGLLSRWYASLQPMKTRKAISNAYKLDESLLESWMHHVSIVRNYCAHHSRIWNRELTFTAAQPKAIANPLTSIWIKSRKIYDTLLIITYFMNIIIPANTWKTDLIALISMHSIDTAQMGFPSNWKSLSFWQ